jgi:superkiller protein 3
MLMNGKFIVLVFLIISLCLSTPGQAMTAKDYLEQGIQLLRQQKFGPALIAFRKSLELDSKSGPAHYNTGLALISLENPKEALVEFGEAVKLTPSDFKTRLALCDTFARLDNHTEAIPQCREAFKLDPTSVDAYGILILSLYKSKQTDEAFNLLSGTLEKFKSNAYFLELAGDLYINEVKFDLALPYFQTLSSLFPKNVAYQVKLAQCYLRTEHDSEAVAAANKVIEIEPKNAAAYYILGKVYYEIGLNDEALIAFQRTVELDGFNGEGFYYLGVIQARMGKRDEAVSSMRKALKLVPDDWLYNYDLGRTLTEGGQFEEAIEPLKKADSLARADFNTKVALGLALFESAHFDEAITVLTKADELKPNNDTVAMFLRVSRERKDVVTRIEKYQVAVAADPTLVNERITLANIYRFLRRMPEAEALYLEANKLQPDDWELYNRMGVFYLAAGQTEKAAPAFAKAAELHPHYVLYLSLAQTLVKLGRNTEALTAFQKSLVIKADSVAVLKPYGDLLWSTGNRQEAVRVYQKALSIEPVNAPLLISLGTLYVKVNNVEGAKQCYETLKTVDPVEAKRFARCLRFKAWL